MWYVSISISKQIKLSKQFSYQWYVSIRNIPLVAKLLFLDHQNVIYRRIRLGVYTVLFVFSHNFLFRVIDNMLFGRLNLHAAVTSKFFLH